MIKLEKLNKYFNKGKGNEIHVLKNINLTLPNKGLVVILGESGSGKTTLLNMVGGLDKPTTGTIHFNNSSFEKYDSKKWDKIRNQEIGYIFQNYNLLHELTVFDNIEMVLKMKGISSKEEITKRIDYITEKLGMFNYQNRKTNALSGGQQQRVAIARALVKNPQLIIADEPTGNLDSKTTIEIMNIIKSISKDKLVILVTHEEEIAEFYGDRIIRLHDGEIVSDYQSKGSGNLELRQDHIIYLKDYKKEVGSFGNIDVISYSDSVSDNLDKIGIEIIQRNETLYFKVSSNKYKRVKNIDSQSEINLLDEHYTPQEKIDENHEFDFEKIINTADELKTKSVITVRDSVRYSLRKIDNLTYGGKMLYVVLGMVGALIAISIGLIGQIFNISDEEFIITNRNYINIHVDEINYEDVMALQNLDYIDNINLVNDQIEFTIETEPYYEIRNPIKLDAHPSDIELLSPDQIIYGTYPETEFDVVIDVLVADGIIKYLSERGIENYEDIINMSIKIQTTGLEGDYGENTSLNFNIVGISNDYSPTIWLTEELIFSIALTSIVDYHVFGDGYEIVTGVMPFGPYQVLLHEDSGLIRNNMVPSSIGIESGQYDVIGTYRYIKDGVYLNTRNVIVSDLSVMKEAYFNQKDYKLSGTEFLAYVSDIDLAIENLALLGINSSSNYEEDLEDYKEFEFVNSLGLFVFALVGIISSGISIFFIMRSSLSSRIYEVSVYRALGAPKNDIRKMFIVEIAIISTISSLIGYLVMVFILIQSQNQVIEYVKVLYYSPISFFLGIVSLYIINVVFGLLPVNLLLFKTPANILSQYDI